MYKKKLVIKLKEPHSSTLQKDIITTKSPKIEANSSPLIIVERWNYIDSVCTLFLRDFHTSSPNGLGVGGGGQQPLSIYKLHKSELFPVFRPISPRTFSDLTCKYKLHSLVEQTELVCVVSYQLSYAVTCSPAPPPRNKNLPEKFLK